MASSTAARHLVAELTSRLQPLERAAYAAGWDASTHASQSTDRRRVEAELALTTALADPDAFAAINATLAENRLEADPMLHRQLTLLRDHFTPHQIDATLREQLVELGTEVDSTFSAFRGDIDGRRVDDNDIAEILRTADDSAERRAAWEASKQVGAEVADRVRELARLRNSVARQLEYRDHFEMALATSELDEERLFATLDEVDRATAAPFEQWKLGVDTQLATRFACSVDELRPWHYDNPFFQFPPAGASVDLDPYFADRDLDDLTIRTFEGVALDIRPVVARSDLRPRDGKNQHAFCVSIDRTDDVRVLCNNVSNHQWAETMLHEFGHAVYDCETDRTLPWLLRTMHPLSTEGVAMMFGHLSNHPEWLGAAVGVSNDELTALGPRLDAVFKAGLLTFGRWVLVMTNFERALYANPEADLNTTWWDLVERFQLLHRPDGRDAPDWAAKIHVASAPVYYQNYLLGELVALQLRDTITTRFGGLVGRPDAGRFLVDEFFRPGASIRWDDLIHQATGHPLTARHLADALAE